VRAYVTRDSVSAADDARAPHARRLSLPDQWTWKELVGRVWRESRLPRIEGGMATWALSSGIPLAVVAQQWQEPRVLFRVDAERERLDAGDGELRLHWSYFAQLDPELVLEVLRNLRLRAATPSR
jgi:hypothetical protein